jgi:glycosyltransferase involved in cell wall biosynthesis
LSAGRDISFLISIARELSRARPTCTLAIAGEGSALHDVKSSCSTERLTNVRFVGALPQADYHRLLARAATGLVVTSASVDSPSFPSKTLDYLAAAIPVLALVNERTDYGDLIAEQWRCGLTAPLGNVDAACQAIIRCLDDHRTKNEMGTRGRAVLERDLTSDHVAGIIVNSATVWRTGR